MSRDVRFFCRSSALLAALLLVPLGSSTGCTTSTTVDYSLFTGITINTQLLLGNNYQCGTGSDEVYKYVAIVINENRDIGGAGVFDCFANGAFANLPGTDAGSLNFAIWIYAYDENNWNNANVGGALENAVTRLNAVTQPVDGGNAVVRANSVPEAGTAVGDAKFLQSICTAPATWTSTCRAASGAGVQVLANCGPLELENVVPDVCALAVLIDGGLDGGHDATVP